MNVQHDPFVAKIASKDGIAVPVARTFAVPADDLFATIETFIGELLKGRFPAQELHDIPASGLVAFVVDNEAVITVDARSARPSHVQCLLVQLKALPPTRYQTDVTGYPLDAETGLTLWTCDGSARAEILSNRWQQITSSGNVDPLVALTTPWLYGNKLRLAPFLGAVAAVTIDDGIPVLDLMAGTGIVGRILSEKHPVFVNDPNPYAALIAQNQGLDLGHWEPSSIIDALKDRYLENHRQLEELVGRSVSEESLFLHGDINNGTLEAYRDFSSRPVLAVSDGHLGPTARLATERYANVYFGVSQAIELDSLRTAIEQAYPNDCSERRISLNALLLASIACTSGPHFAQPAQVRSIKSFHTVMERRARSIVWEFELALARLMARPTTAMPISGLSGSGWRQAIEEFKQSVPGVAKAVYVDPPYSKLQYSRYYHVLNVLLSYDYPTVSGTGRYPPKERRFSSRFEYQPGTAQRELADLIRVCAESGLTTILSYGDTGFVKIDAIVNAMSQCFERVTLFSEALRHHSQGRRLASSRGTIVEYAIVGHTR